MMRRFFFDGSGAGVGDTVRLSTEESRHITKVLRLKEGERVELLDGKGGLFSAVISRLGKTVEVELLTKEEQRQANRRPLIVGQGVLKGKKMEMVVQKCTELGVNDFLPFISERCQGRPSLQQEAKKNERYLRIMEEACKQCKRTELMAIKNAESWGGLLNRFECDRERVKLLFYEDEVTVGLHDIDFTSSSGTVVILIGPEGGFTMEEVERARAAGFVSVSLGKNILRAETAALSAVSIVQFLSGNI